MQTFNFYLKLGRSGEDRSRRWVVQAANYTAARKVAEELSDIPKSKLIGYRVAIKK